MANDTNPPLSAADYEAIAAAVMETGRGRWVLAEFARRNRHADTQALLDAIQRVERAVEETATRPLAAGSAERDLSDIAASLARTRQEIATSIAQADGGMGEPLPDKAFDDLVAVADRAATDSFGAAEKVQEAVWSLRASGDVDGVASELDRHAMDVYRASSDQALTAARLRSLIGVLRGIEAKINVLLGRPVAPPESTPSTVPVEVSTMHAVPAIRADDIDFVAPRPDAERRVPARPAQSLPPPEPAVVAAAPAGPPPRQPSPRALPFEAIDALDTEARLKMFV
jgi:chemotaxis protein CheZ